MYNTNNIKVSAFLFDLPLYEIKAADRVHALRIAAKSLCFASEGILPHVISIEIENFTTFHISNN